MLVMPQVYGVLAMLAVAFALAALPFLRTPRHSRRASFPMLLPHPSQPGSMLSFVAVSSLLIMLTLARLGIFVSSTALEPINGPRSGSRLVDAPEGVVVGIVEEAPNETRRFTYPRNTAELTVDAARRAESTSRDERVRAVRDLAWWTGVCPNYGPFTLVRLRRALRDPDPGVKGAAAIGLGSTGGHGAPAVPDLLAARGTSVRYFDHLVAEAIVLIQQGPRWPPARECEDVSVTELEGRAHGPLAAAVVAGDVAPSAGERGGK
jgi:hypothetical protein